MSDLMLQLIFGALRDGSIYALVGLGLASIHRVTDVMFFAQGSLAMIGGVTLHALCAYTKMPIIFAIPIGLSFAVGAALACERLVVAPLIRRQANSLNITIVTIGLAFILEMIVLLLFGKDPLEVPPFSGEIPIFVRGASLLPQDIWIVGTLLLSAILLILFYKKTWTGKGMTGLGLNRLLAKSLGFPISRLFTYSFIFAGLTGGAAGMLYAPVAYTGYFIGIPLTVKGFVAAAVGGVNNPLGAVIGGLIIGVFESFVSGYISSGLKDVITMLLLLAVLYWRPSGLMGER